MIADLLIAAGQVFLTIGAILMLINRKTHIDPVLAWFTAASLFLVSQGLFMLSAPMSGAIAGIAVFAWLGIAIFRGRDSNLM